MPIWGIVLLALMGWVVLSIGLALIIGRAVRKANIEQADRNFVYQLGKMPEPGRGHIRPPKPIAL